MDLLYSGALLVALLAGAVGSLLAIIALRKRLSTFARIGTGILLFGAFSLILSVGVPAYWGHGPASAEPMDRAAFAAAHKAFFMAGTLIILGIGLCVYVCRRHRDPSKADRFS